MMYAICPICSTNIPDNGKDSNNYNGELSEIKRCPMCGLIFRVIVEADVWAVVSHWVNKTKE